MRFKKGDIIILVIIVAAMISYFGIKSLNKDKNNKAIVIHIDGSEYERVLMKDITEDRQLHIDFKKDRFIDINIGKDGVYVSDVVCPDRICVKTGIISEVGESIVCLPNKVLIYIEGEGKNVVDNVSY